MTHKPMTQDEVLEVLDAVIDASADEGQHLLGTDLHESLAKARATIAAWNVSPSADVVEPLPPGVYSDAAIAADYAARRKAQLAQQGGESKDE